MIESNSRYKRALDLIEEWMDILPDKNSLEERTLDFLVSLTLDYEQREIDKESK